MIHNLEGPDEYTTAITGYGEVILGDGNLIKNPPSEGETNFLDLFISFNISLYEDDMGPNEGSIMVYPYGVFWDDDYDNVVIGDITLIYLGKSYYEDFWPENSPNGCVDPLNLKINHNLDVNDTIRK